MPRRPREVSNSSKKRRAPAKTLEARENQLISLAVDLAEKQLSEGTASSQVITHYLKLGSTVERLEREKLARENELLKAKTESLKSGKNQEKLYIQALEAMARYAGRQAPVDGSDDDD